jgi:hypothetical protein
MDMQEFLKNRQKFPIDTLAKYAGKQVAWSPDGTSIVAGADELSKLIEAVRATGHDPGECVFSSVPASDSLIGCVEGEEFLLRRVGRTSVLMSENADPWDSMAESLDEFTDDFMSDRARLEQQAREPLFD